VGKPVSELYGSLSAPAAVICGGGKTVSQLKEIPEGCFIIFANHHGAGLLEPDLAVAVDEHAFLIDEFKTLPCPKVGRTEGDYLIEEFVPGGSGAVATNLAVKMGASHVYVVGADCYETIPNHWHGDEAYGHIDGKPIEFVSKNMRPKDFRICKKAWDNLAKDRPITIL
jgi:hypothetical protein